MDSTHEYNLIMQINTYFTQYMRKMHGQFYLFI